MKYFKILLIPFIAFVLMVPVKAEEVQVPYDDVFREKNYVVAYPYRFYWGYQRTLRHVDTFNGSGSRKGKLSFVFEGSGSEGINFNAEELINGEWVPITVDMGGNTAYPMTSTSYTGPKSFALNHVNYSSVSLYTYYDELLFPEAPVRTHAQLRQIATGAAITEMGDKVSQTSGTISLVGGVILGLVLVPALVSRFRYWVRV